MKKYLRVLALTLAAAFVFAACDSSGGGGDPREETAMYKSADGNTVLTLTYSAAAQKSPARQAPAAGQRGTYTLEVNGDIKSRGSFRSTGVTLTFTSDGSKKFTANVVIGTLIFENGKIPLDEGGELTVSLKEEMSSFTVDDLVPGSIESGALGLTLAFTDEQVYEETGDLDLLKLYDGNQDLTLGNGSGKSTIFTGAVTGGKFTVSVGESDFTPATLAAQHDTNDFTRELFAYYDNVKFNDNAVLCFLMDEFEVVEAQNQNEWQSFSNCNDILSFGSGNTFANGEAEVRYIYVQNAVTFSGTGKTVTETDADESMTTTSESFSISLSAGWNAIYKVELYKGTYTSGNPNNPDTLGGVNSTGTFSFKSGFPAGLPWQIVAD